MPYPYVGSLNLSKIHFAPLTNANGRKQVELFLDASSTLGSNKIKFQLCPDEKEPILTRYSLDSVREDSDPTRRGLTVILRNPATIAALQAMEAAIVDMAVASSKEWFKKELTRDQVLLRFKPILAEHPDEPGTFLMKLKVKCRGAKVPTKFLRLVDGSQLKSSNEDDLSARGALVVPLISTYSLWFMAGDAQFGASFQAEEMIVTPGDAPSETSNFTLTKTMEVVKGDEDDKEGGAAAAAPTGDGDDEPGAKRIKVDLEGAEERAL